MKKVYIDTSSYVKSGLNFSSGTYKQLKALVDCGDVKILTSQLILGELKQYIKQSKKKALNSLKGIEKEYLIKNNVENIDILKSEINQIEEKLMQILVDFKLLDINVKELNIETIVNDYLENKPPFSLNNDKKYEFPDAICLHSLLKYLGNSHCCVISEDEDWKNFCEKHTEQLSYYPSLKLFLNSWVESNYTNDEILEYFKSNILTELDFLKEKVRDAFMAQSFYHDDSIIAESYVELKEILNIDFDDNDLSILFYDKNNKIIEIERFVYIDFKVEISGYDANCWHKDDETKNVFYIDGIDNKTIIQNEKRTKILNMTFSYDENMNFKIIECDLDTDIIYV